MTQHVTVKALLGVALNVIHQPFGGGFRLGKQAADLQDLLNPLTWFDFAAAIDICHIADALLR